MNEKKKFIKMLERFFSEIDQNKAWQKYPEVALDINYLRSKFFRLLTNPNDEWTFEIIRKSLTPIMPRIVNDYGKEAITETY